MAVMYSEHFKTAFAETQFHNKYAHKVGERKEKWPEMAERVSRSVMGSFVPKDAVERVQKLIEQKKFVPGGRYLYAAGRPYPQVNNCFLFDVHDSREGWGDLTNYCTNALMTGGGVGVVYSKLREEGAYIRGMGGNSTGPCALMQMINECGRHIMQGGTRRAAIWAGLLWDHPDIMKFIGMKNRSILQRMCQEQDFNFPLPMDMTNMSVILNGEFFLAFHSSNHPKHSLAQQVFWLVVKQMVTTGEPAFSVDTGEHEGENLRNACTEVTSRDNGDCCNLASLNLAAFSTLDEFREALPDAVSFLLCGTLYSKLPVPKMYEVREKNRRLGLGLMGVHAWLIKRGYKYGMCDELKTWMAEYAKSGEWADLLCDETFGISRPVATRSIAPTGTISIVAETTSGIEPIFAVAYKRRYLKGGTGSTTTQDWKYQYVVDSMAQELIEGGANPKDVEDAYTLAEDIDRRVGFQVDMQKYVDHGISSTLNLPEWGSSVNNEDTVKLMGYTLIKHLPNLRGITAYPNGARGGQPLNRVSYEEALKFLGREFDEAGLGRSEVEALGEAACKVGGFCNS